MCTSEPQFYSANCNSNRVAFCNCFNHYITPNLLPKHASLTRNAQLKYSVVFMYSCFQVFLYLTRDLNVGRPSSTRPTIKCYISGFMQALFTDLSVTVY